MKPIPIYVGFDPREASAYHVFCNSVLRNASVPVCFIPLSRNVLNFDGRRDGSNDFIYSRFLVPYLSGFKGHAIFCDGDMICTGDIKELWAMRVYDKAVQVVKHDYRTKFPKKYLGNRNEDYPRKNWSSVMLWNCGAFQNRCLTPDYIKESDGAHLHRFRWLDDSRIGDLPLEWNWLVSEYDHNSKAKLYHYTIGTPCFREYKACDHSGLWWSEYERTIEPT